MLPNVIFGTRNIPLGFCNTSYVRSGDQYAPNLKELAKNEVIPYLSDKDVFTSMGAIYGDTFITNLGMGDPTTCVYQFIIDKTNQHPVLIV